MFRVFDPHSGRIAFKTDSSTAFCRFCSALAVAEETGGTVEQLARRIAHYFGEWPEPVDYLLAAEMLQAA